MIVKAKNICYAGMPKIELPREVEFPDGEDICNNWQIVYELVKSWKKDLEILEILKEFLKNFDEFRLNLLCDLKWFIKDEDYQKVKEWLNEQSTNIK